MKIENQKDAETVDEFLALMVETIGIFTDSRMTAVVCFSKNMNVGCVDGFDPKEKPELLPVFVAMMTTFLQTAIIECGSLDEICIKRGDEYINMKENMAGMSKMIHAKLN